VVWNVAYFSGSSVNFPTHTSEPDAFVVHRALCG